MGDPASPAVLSQGLFIFNAVNSASISLLVYEYLITLELEIEHFWRQQSRGFWLFIACRYLTFMLILVFGVMSFATFKISTTLEQVFVTLYNLNLSTV
ncbi:hypothetical protein EV714DRAFT_276570 [Schizophyllum commune]